MNLNVDFTKNKQENTSCTYTSTDLSERFEKLNLIGSGGQGYVFSVKERSSGNMSALKIAKYKSQISDEHEQLKQIISAILNQLSVHLTRIHEFFSVKWPVGATLTSQDETDFISRENSNSSKTLCHRVCLMELLEGDLAQLFVEKEVSKEEKIIYDIQLASIQLILYQQGILPLESGRTRNILYKKLDKDDLLQGKAMLEFDFWKYVFGEHTFYLPRSTYLIKLGDYDFWFFDESKNYDPAEFLKNKLMQNFDLSIEELKDLFKKPENTDTKILDVYNSSIIKLEE